ncbi:MAG: hypothetical protein CTY20_09575 [Hyphomicrobium sp.]|nr:MAG: hypothetical protein CTY20_09575 [Hyphomicrobium sp.]
MTNTLLIGIVAGLAAALLFATAAVGSVPVRLVGVLLTGLPLVIAGMGWGRVASGIGALSGVLALTVAVSPSFGLAFLVSQAIPLVYLVHLSGLSRVVPATVGTAGPASGQAATEWYPAGGVVAAAAIMSGLLALGLMLMLGPDMSQIKSSLRGFAESFATKMFPEIAGGRALNETEIAELAEISLLLLPAAMALSVMATMLFNVWLGSRLALAGGVLSRPWPDLSLLTLPRAFPALFALATVGTFFAGYSGLLAAAFFGALFFAFVLVGLAVIHNVTRGHPWRSFALWGIYGAVIVFSSLAMPLIAVLGLADGIRPLRQSGGPSPPRPSTGAGPPAS